MSIKYFKFSLYSFLIFGFVIGIFVFRANAQISNTSTRLAGSYQLDTSRSANIQTIVAKASQQNRLTAPYRMDLETKLNPPANISIEVSGKQVILASSTSNPTALNADGVMKTAYGSNGTKVNIRSSLINDTLKVASHYNNTNYSITFRPINNGRNLQVTRTVKTNYLQQTVLATSLYSRISSPPVFANKHNGDPSFSDNTFIVPNGTVLAVVLENYISTTASQNNDMFRLTVQSPQQFQGAMIEGYLSDIERANNMSGRAKITLNFQRIKLTNGQTYEFSGVIHKIETSKKNPTKSSNKNQIKGGNKTNESIKRGVLGTGIGAVIGATVGGKKGALIGAIIGGGAGTGTVFLEGKDLELKRGSQLNIQSTSPN